MEEDFSGESDDEDSSLVGQYIFQYNALISHFLHVPFPEELDEDQWLYKASQVRWLEKSKILPVQLERNGKKNT